MFSYIGWPITWQYLTASVQGSTDLNAEVKVAPPRNFKARWISGSECSVEATWDLSNHCNVATSWPNCYVDGYRLNWNLSTSGAVSTFDVEPGTSSGYTILALPCDSANYNLNIRSYYGNKESTVLTTSTKTPPIDATNLTCSLVWGDHLTLVWNKSISVPALNTQKLYQDGVLINTFDNITETSLVESLLAGTEYNFILTSLNLNGDESPGVVLDCFTDSGSPPDNTPPNGSVEINVGDTYTNYNIVDLSLTNDDAIKMKFSNSSTGPWSDYETYSGTKTAWDMNDISFGGNANQGTKTVYVRLIDDNNNETTTEISDSIIFDSINPTSSANPVGWKYNTNQTITLATNPDAIIKYAIGVSGDCWDWGVVYSEYSTPIEIEKGVNEGKLCFYAIDTAGNTEISINEELYEVDTEVPESHVLALSTYTKKQTFDVVYTTSSSTDLDYVELYYSYEGWAYQQYTDTLHADGHFFLSPIEFIGGSDWNYAFYTQATDDVGNVEEIPLILPDSGAETIVDTIGPTDPVTDLDSSSDLKCNNQYDPRCHTEIYDVPVTFIDNSDFAEMFISGNVTSDSGSTYYGNVNQWIPFSTVITIPLDPTVNNPTVSKNKTITYKVRDAAGNESNVVSDTFRLWKSSPVIISTDVTVRNCTDYKGICYSDQTDQLLDVNVSSSEENQYYEFFLSGDVTGSTANQWLLYRDYGGTIPFEITSGDGLKDVIFQVRSPSGQLSNSITKEIKLRQNAPTFDYQVDSSICNSDSTPSVCYTYQSVISLDITLGEDATEMYITGNVNAGHGSYGGNVDNWITADTNKIIAVTDGLGLKNIYLKVKDIFNHESSEVLRRIEVVERPASESGGHSVSTGDRDNDGMPDDWEEEYGFNPDDPDDADSDPDEDGLVNLDEYTFNSNPLLSDTDEDGLLDWQELTACPYILDGDTDNDGLNDGDEVSLGTDPCNTDSDGDGVSDGVEVESGTDPLDPSNNNVVDADEDGIPNAWEKNHWLDPNDSSDAYEDRDSDGLINREEYEKGTDLDVADTDSDGLKDGEEVKQYYTDPLDTDTDGDGSLDGQEVRNGTDPLDPTDPGTANINDEDGNGLDDDWEDQYYQDLPHSSDWYKNRDTDQDGLTDYEEYIYGTNPLIPDTDQDGLTDYEEMKTYNTDPNKQDSDGDELKDGEEVNEYKTNPNEKDTDWDKFGDGSEIKLGTDPLDPNSFPGDRDGDGMPDQWEEDNALNPDDASDANQDPDHDGLSNRAEYQWNTDPHNPDTDGDDLTDGREVQIGTDPLDPDSKFPDENKNGIDDNWEMLYFNELRDDLGSRDFDGDGLSDKLEYDYKTNPLKEDTDGDGLTDAEEVFVYGTDPLDPQSNKKYFAITNIKDNTFLSTGDPLIKGTAPPGGIVKITFENDNYEEVASVLTRADSTSVFIGKLSVDLNKDQFNDIDLSKFEMEELNNLSELQDGKYFVFATLYDDEGRKRSKTKKLLLEVDATLNLVAPNPQYLSIEELTVDNFFQGVEVVICDKRPEVRGTTYFGSQVVATWRSLVLTSSLIADSDVGDFVIKSPKPLELGDHTVTLYAITPDGIRSPDLTVSFTITNESDCHGAAPVIPTESEWNYLWFLLASIFSLISFFFLILWKRREEKKKIACELEKIGYIRSENTAMKNHATIAGKKIFTKKDSLKDMRRFLKFAKWKKLEEEKKWIKNNQDNNNINDHAFNWKEDWENWRNYKKWGKAKKGNKKAKKE